ncbi:RNA recognition motif and CCHC-type zinc finger domains containing protein [Perilla frutescens var. frutescens]|nr:RNA recognition motif and CCHC-type zinc finger domains containing protein [Perilla frutescens var. frutescens]
MATRLDSDPKCFSSPRISFKNDISVPKIFRMSSHRAPALQEAEESSNEGGGLHDPPPRENGPDFAREEVSFWWESYSRTMTPEQRQALVWTDLKELILTRYFPESFKTKMETEFLNLRQGGMTVIEYERRFNCLSRYAPYIVDTDEKKARHFERGLRPEIAGILLGQRLRTYGEVIEMAQAISHGLQLDQKDQRQREAFDKRKWEPQDRGKGKAPMQNKFHLGECRAGQRVCFTCGDPSHMSYYCPKGKKEQERKVKPRLFTLEGVEKNFKEGEDTMSGILRVSDVPALVLFNSGASHSFISVSFCSKLGVLCKDSGELLEISIPSGKRVSSSKMAYGLKLEINNRVLRADLHILEMRDFNVILGMDWFSGNHATIRCRDHEVEFNFPSEPKLIFYGARTRSTKRSLQQ